jgi:WD40 repeat protein
MSKRVHIGRGKVVAAILGLGIVATALSLGSPATASFPGANGLIAYVTGGNIFVVNPANPVPTQVTNTGNFVRSKFNATGTKLVAAASSGLVTLDPVAGSAITPIPNTTGNDIRPAFDPTGTKVVFRATGVGLVTIDVAGTNRTNIVNGNHTRPDWSADGTFIAFEDLNGIAIRRVSPTGANLVTLATTGPGGANACAAATFCDAPTVSPDSTKVAFAQTGAATAGLAQVNADGTTVTPSRLTTGANDDNTSYAPDGTKLAFTRAGALSTVLSDGSATVTPVDAIGAAGDTNWGVAAGTGTGTGTGTGATFSITGPAGKVKSGPCVFTVTASSAATGSVNFTAAVVSGKNAPSPASGAVAFANQTSNPVSISVKHSRRKHGDVSVSLTSATGGTVGTPSSATCDVGKK